MSEEQGAGLIGKCVICLQPFVGGGGIGPILSQGAS